MIFKRIIAGLCACAAAVCFAAAACADIEYRDEEVAVPPRMLYLGDSIATGFGLEGYAEDRSRIASYANILRDAYTAELPEDCGFEMENLAVDGMTSEELLNGLVKGEYDGKLDVDVIVISIGGNDLLHVLTGLLADAGITGSEGISAGALLKLIQAVAKLSDTCDEKLALFDENMKNIGEYLHSRTEARVIVQTLYNPFEEFSLVPGLKDLATEKIAKLDELISKNSGGGTVYNVCDVVPFFAGKSKELTNIGNYDIHPNAQGHQVISECLDKTVRAFKYSYKKAYEVEPAAAEAEDGDSSAAARSNASEDESSSTGYIIVAAVAGVLLAAVVITVVVVYVKRSKQGAGASLPNGDSTREPSEPQDFPDPHELPANGPITGFEGPPESEPIVPVSVIPEPKDDQN